MTFGMLPQIAFPPFKGLVLQNKHWYPIPQVFSVKTQCSNKLWYPYPQVYFMKIRNFLVSFSSDILISKLCCINKLWYPFPQAYYTKIRNFLVSFSSDILILKGL